MSARSAAERRLQFLLHGEAAYSESASLARPLARYSKAAQDLKTKFEAASERRVAVAFGNDKKISMGAVKALQDEVTAALCGWTLDLPSAAPVAAAGSECLDALRLRVKAAQAISEEAEDAVIATATVRVREYAASLADAETRANQARDMLHDTNMRCAQAAQLALASSDKAAARLAARSASLEAELSSLVSQFEGARALEQRREDSVRDGTPQSVAAWREMRERSEHDDEEERERRRQRVRVATRKLEARTVQHVRTRAAARVAAYDAELGRCDAALDALEAGLVKQQRDREQRRDGGDSSVAEQHCLLRVKQHQQALVAAALKEDLHKLLATSAALRNSEK